MNNSEKKLTEPGRTNETAVQVHQKSSYSGKTPRQVMSKHIQDRNDVITDEDFNNLNISSEISNDTAHPALVISNDKERPKDENKDHVIITPWDVIG